MKYYSEKTKKLYETEEELRASEKDFDTQELEKQQQLEVKKDLAKNVEDAYKAYVEAVKAANKIAEEALKRNKPMKVEIGTLYNFKFPICPNCKTELNEYYKYANKFCKKCGQRLDWSDNETGF